MRIQPILDFGDGWFVDTDHRFACNKTSKLKVPAPQMIVLHWTAGRYAEVLERAERMKAWAANEKEKQSTNFVILRDGTIFQLVPTTKAAWHSGESAWQLADGRSIKSCNYYSIGIDLDLVGPVTLKNEVWVDGKGYPVFCNAQQEGKKCYEKPTDAQFYALRVLIDVLRTKYNIPLRDIVGHRDVSPGRKIDPGPFVNVQELGLING